ncbi:hypothetical protein JQK19_04825 [Chromobacterium violaceum]|uniref:hypothetical protein n=1 Tax=Chromobacterium violaceum TaxID=536 RepID=UPI001BECA811|nr:hypothetical protein [Chromobacterium violaceum]MBT2866559.1 hypothetical protein [Chromobacterium violaceum]
MITELSRRADLGSRAACRRRRHRHAGQTLLARRLSLTLVFMSRLPRPESAFRRRLDRVVAEALQAGVRYKPMQNVTKTGI